MRSLLRRSPGTSVWLFTALVTTGVVRSTSPALSGELMRQVSTNVFQMGRSGGRVLFLSAFLFGDGGTALLVVVFLLVSLPLERVVGTWRWLGVVAAGHIGATLVTTFGIWADVRSHPGASGLVQAIDVGPSYGLFAACGFAAAGLRSPKVRLAALMVLAAVVGWPFLGTPTFTDTGHLSAAVIGAAMWLVVPAVPSGSGLRAPWAAAAGEPSLRELPHTAP